jgi:hypothetical protein
MSVFNQDPPGGLALSRVFLSNIDHEYIHQSNVSSLQEGLDAVKAGHSWGVIGIGPNFTTSTIQRFLFQSNDAIAGSEVLLYMDNSNMEVTINVQQTIYKAYQAMVNDELRAVNKSTEFASLPVFLEKPVYGEANPSFTNFVAPGAFD